MSLYCSTCYKAVPEGQDCLQIGLDRFYHPQCVTCTNELCSSRKQNSGENDATDNDVTNNISFWAVDDSWWCDTCYNEMTRLCFACRNIIAKGSKYIEFDSWASTACNYNSPYMPKKEGIGEKDNTLNSLDSVSLDCGVSTSTRKNTFQFHLNCFKCSVGRCSNRWISTCADNFYINYADSTLICTTCMKYYKNLTTAAQKRYSRSLDRRPSLFGKRPNPVYVAKTYDKTNTIKRDIN